MANIDCEQAFNQEMQALKDVKEQLEKIAKFIGYDKKVSDQTLISRVDETNRLLRLLCVGILGKAE